MPETQVRVTEPPPSGGMESEASPPPPSPTGACSRDSEAAGSARILIVDDEEAIRHVLREALSAQGYSCATAGGAGEARDWLARERFDLLISDICLPDMSGISLLDELWEAGQGQIDTIMITGSGDVETAIRALRHGAVDYVLKPFKLNELLRRIREILQQRQGRLKQEAEQRALKAVLDEQKRQLAVAKRQQVSEVERRSLSLLQQVRLEETGGRLEDQVERLLEIACDLFRTPSGRLLLYRRGHPQEMVFQARRTRPVVSGESPELPDEEIQSMVETRQPLLLKDPARPGYSAICVPLLEMKDLGGLLYLERHPPASPFSPEDLRVLATTAYLLAMKVENLYFEERLVEQQRLKQELTVAGEIQRRLLPAAPPDVTGYDCSGLNVPCYEVGGDYYDFRLYDGTKLGIAIGDVAGKGTGAALLMASVQAFLHSYMDMGIGLDTLMKKLNQSVHEHSSPNKFVTLFYGELNPATHHLRYVNAGHNNPLLLRAGGAVEQLTRGGVPLGLFPDYEFEQGELTLEAGDRLVLFSDGLSERWNPAEEMYGEERLLSLARTHARTSCGKLQQLILEDLETFAAGTSSNDDLTLVLLQRLADPRPAD